MTQNYRVRVGVCFLKAETPFETAVRVGEAMAVSMPDSDYCSTSREDTFRYYLTVQAEDLPDSIRVGTEAVETTLRNVLGESDLTHFADTDVWVSTNRIGSDDAE